MVHVIYHYIQRDSPQLKKKKGLLREAKKKKISEAKFE